MPKCHHVVFELAWSDELEKDSKDMYNYRSEIFCITYIYVLVLCFFLQFFSAIFGHFEYFKMLSYAKVALPGFFI